LSQDLAFCSALSLRRKLAAREISAAELCDLYLGRIARLGARSKSFIEVCEAGAKDAAAACDRDMSGGDGRALLGLPYALKDLIDVEGVRTTGGSRVLHDNVATENAACVDGLMRAGGVFLGKTNLHEFAYGATGENTTYGTPVNAYDETRLACGSSSGSAAAVAFGLCAFALGTDTGGSVRAPAVLNGLVGLKPTLGRVSTRGVLPYCWSFDHVGTVTRSVADAALVLEAIAGYDPLDPVSSTQPVGPYSKALGREIGGLRVGVPETFYLERADSEILAASEAVLRHLEASGAELKKVLMPSMEHCRAVSLAVQMPEALSYHSRFLEERGELYGRDFRAGLALGQCLLAEHYVRAKRYVELYRRQTSAVFDEVDVLVTPATPVIAPKLGTVKVRLEGVEEAAGNAVTRYTTFFNMTGHPAITLPVGLHSEGLPMGVQVVARHFGEETLFATAGHIERHEPFRIQAPTIV
jgi:aspartyl-tRNA(Asn)/glutamyl-tRNA(Gln) amidotransferase subunit A